MSALNARLALTEAIAVERQNARRYAGWSIRMRPFDSDASALLKSLADEEREHQQYLTALFVDRFGEAPKEVDPGAFMAGIEMERFIGDRHFFVVDAPMAVRILTSALELEAATQAFYRRVGSESTDVGLTAAYQALSAFEDEHVAQVNSRLRALDAAP